MPSHNPKFEGEKMKKGKKAARKVCAFHAERGQDDLCLYGPGGKKKGNPPKKVGRSAPRTRKKPRKVMKRGKVGHRMVKKAPLWMEVGKTYESENGEFRLKVREPFEQDPKNQVRVDLLKFPPGNEPWCDVWHRNGYYWDAPPYSGRIMVREVPSAPRPVARRAKGAR